MDEAQANIMQATTASALLCLRVLGISELCDGILQYLDGDSFVHLGRTCQALHHAVAKEIKQFSKETQSELGMHMQI